MQTRKTVLPLSLALLAFFGNTARPPAEQETSRQRASHLITVADDFIIDVYHNGVRVPDNKRQLRLERFGATVEQIDIVVREGDWIVFNLVNNRLRWGGVHYLGVAGCLGTNEFGFVSELDSGAWSVCDDLRQVDRFIQEQPYL